MNQQLVFTIISLMVTITSVMLFQSNYSLLLHQWSSEDLDSYRRAGSPKSHQIYNTLPLLGFGIYKNLITSQEIRQGFIKNRIHFFMNLVLVALTFWLVTNTRTFS